MTDLNARLDEIAKEAAEELDPKFLDSLSSLQSVIRAALDKAIEAVLTAEVTPSMWHVGQDMRPKDFKVSEIYRAMTAALLTELKEMQNER